MPVWIVYQILIYSFLVQLFAITSTTCRSFLNTPLKIFSLVFSSAAIKFFNICTYFFHQHNDEADLIALEIAVKGKYIMTCNTKNQLVIWNLRGDILESVDTRHGDTYCARLSPCGRFVATSGWWTSSSQSVVNINKLLMEYVKIGKKRN